MEKDGFCPRCSSVRFTLNFDEFQKLRIFISDVLYRKGKPTVPSEIYDFDRMLQDINCSIRKEF